MGRRTRLVRKRVTWATLVHGVLFRRAGEGLLGASGVSECVRAPTTSLCGGAALAAHGDGRAKSYASKEDGASTLLFFGIFFLFGRFVILTETNVRGKNVLVRKQKLHLL